MDDKVSSPFIYTQIRQWMSINNVNSNSPIIINNNDLLLQHHPHQQLLKVFDIIHLSDDAELNRHHLINMLMVLSSNAVDGLRLSLPKAYGSFMSTAWGSGNTMGGG